ncbi:MAG: inositol monophosphatase family protein [Alphaproteobacteria bacterium]|nr:inositol monophosphatase family protein [Alphaproteobacteria bacterium]MDP7222643.1 inositol monophosphatase family protein [Alphaproteobacteria bacterium]
MALSPIMNTMIRAAEKAGKSLARDFGEVEQLQVSRKGPGDFVSAADLRAEKILFEELKEARPGFAFLMEESGEVSDNDDYEYRWIIDPLDGTANFLHGIPHWAISIALEQKMEDGTTDIVAGLIYDPIKDEAFRAEKGEGAFVRNKRLRVSGRTELDHSIITTGAPKRNKDAMVEFLTEYKGLLARVPNIRRYGSAALDMAYVAAGRFEAYWERGINAWDIAAGHLIVKEAKGSSTLIDKGDDSPVHAGQILATNATLHNELRKLLVSGKKEKDAA